MELSLWSPQRVGKTADQQQNSNPIRGAKGGGPVYADVGAGETNAVLVGRAFGRKSGAQGGCERVVVGSREQAP